MTFFKKKNYLKKFVSGGICQTSQADSLHQIEEKVPLDIPQEMLCYKDNNGRRFYFFIKCIILYFFRGFMKIQELSFPM